MTGKGWLQRAALLGYLVLAFAGSWNLLAVGTANTADAPGVAYSRLGLGAGVGRVALRQQIAVLLRPSHELYKVAQQYKVSIRAH